LADLEMGKGSNNRTGWPVERLATTQSPPSKIVGMPTFEVLL
jgi:hypothetical protein